jgi:hypothetical protein
LEVHCRQIGSFAQPAEQVGLVKKAIEEDFINILSTGKNAFKWTTCGLAVDSRQIKVGDFAW